MEMIASKKEGKLTGLSERSSDVILIVICAIILLIVAYPLYYVLIASLSNPYDVYAGKTFLLPSGFTFDGYKAIFADDSMLTGLINSFKYTIIGTVFSVVMLYMTAYPLSVKDLPGGVAVGNMIIVRNFFENSIPKEMIEAAEIDGASKWTTFLKIVVPLSRSIMAVMVVFSMVAYWNDWFTAMIYLPSPAKAPLPLVLRNILIKSSASAAQASTISGGFAELNKMTEMIKFSSIIVAALPMLVIYPFVQKYFEKGFMAGAVKG